MDSSEEKAITALGILNTMETILNVMENQKEVCISVCWWVPYFYSLTYAINSICVFISFQILTQLEGIVLNVIGVILQKNIMGKKLLQICFQKNRIFFLDGNLLVDMFRSVFIPCMT